MGKFLTIATLIMGGTLFLVPAAGAHFLWLNPPALAPKPGQALAISLGWGHHFPASEKCDAAKIGAPRVLGPGGEAAPLKMRDKLNYLLTPAKAGCHLVMAAYAPGVVSKTPEGYKHQDKTGLKEVSYCFRYDLRGKAVLAAPGGVGYDRTVGDILEIVPRANPADLKPGDKMPILVLFKGKPLAGAQVQATHQGYSDQPNKFAWEGKTDAQGLAVAPLAASGLQLIAVTYKMPYAKREKCDDQMYKYTLTFRLK